MSKTNGGQNRMVPMDSWWVPRDHVKATVRETFCIHVIGITTEKATIERNGKIRDPEQAERVKHASIWKNYIRVEKANALAAVEAAKVPNPAPPQVDDLSDIRDSIVSIAERMRRLASAQEATKDMLATIAAELGLKKEPTP